MAVDYGMKAKTLEQVKDVNLMVAPESLITT